VCCYRRNIFRAIHGMTSAQDIFLRTLQEHSRLQPLDESAARSLSARVRRLQPDEDLVREGDEPEAAALVLEGVVARYHTLANGKRQYLSFHISGDLPAAQTLFVEKMDHAVCAVGKAQVAMIAHEDILTLFKQRPLIGLAIWRKTLIDAAIFREAITNNSTRPPRTRMAHLFCELYCRARSSGLEKIGTFTCRCIKRSLGTL
jgi:CRP-like cAMP-binding protein